MAVGASVDVRLALVSLLSVSLSIVVVLLAKMGEEVCGWREVLVYEASVVEAKKHGVSVTREATADARTIASPLVYCPSRRDAAAPPGLTGLTHTPFTQAPGWPLRVGCLSAWSAWLAIDSTWVWLSIGVALIE